MNLLLKFMLCSIILTACDQPTSSDKSTGITTGDINSNPRFNIYSPIKLTADLSHLSKQQKEMIELLIDAGKIMDDLFWRQAYTGNKQELLSKTKNPAARRFIEINYGPWDRLDDNRPFINNVGDKPAGANFYPPNFSKAEFDKLDIPGKDGLYSLIRRDEKNQLKLIPYNEAYKGELSQAAELLKQASKLAQDKGFKNYLKLRADALLNNEYQASDMAWMDLKTNPVELVIGPIENYEDQLFGYRAAFEAFVLIKDQAWSERLSHFTQFLPELQKNLPISEEYKQEKPGGNADLNAYDAIYYGGDSNAGAKTIAINLPNDEEVQLKKGTRRLQLKNAMRAKFDKIVIPIADKLINESQRKNITFNAFFSIVMFHEVAHGLGIKNTINDKGTVRGALKETASAIEEGKADILGLYMITELYNKGEIKEGEIMDYYVTFLASIFRSVRFGASSAHGKANMIRFNFFNQLGAFKRNQATGRYHVIFENMLNAVTSLSTLILTIQGDGDYEAAQKLIRDKGIIGQDLRSDLDRLAEANIPVDIYFIQGKEVLGLK